MSVITLCIAALGLNTLAHAQNLSVTSSDRVAARQTASTGIPVADLAAGAPDVYIVKSGDTLWAISRMYLKSPWRWPELWGMNKQDIKNPHWIYPGQKLYLDKSGGNARLSTQQGNQGDGIATIKVEPRTRAESLSGTALPTLNPGSIEPFLSEAIVVDENTLANAPRIVAGDENRVMMVRGTRAYARGPLNAPLVETGGQAQQFRVFRQAKPLVDPVTGELLGYEAQYLGRARMVRGESTETDMVDGKAVVSQVPASLDIIASREEMRRGDRLLPEPPAQLISYTPRAPKVTVTDGRIVSIYGEAVQFAAQNQVVAVNKGARDGIASGDVMAILRNGDIITDRTGETPERLKLPNERAGLLMVFRVFDKVSYALVLEISSGLRVGDRLTNP